MNEHARAAFRRHDAQVQAAIKLARDPARYDALLAPPKEALKVDGVASAAARGATST